MSPSAIACTFLICVSVLLGACGGAGTQPTTAESTRKGAGEAQIKAMPAPSGASPGAGASGSTPIVPPAAAPTGAVTPTTAPKAETSPVPPGASPKAAAPPVQPLGQIAGATAAAAATAALSGVQSPRPSASPPKAEAQAAAKPEAGRAEAVLQVLKVQGLPIGESIAFTAETDPNNLLGRPNQYISKVNFLDTRLERTRPERIDVEDGGSVQVFRNEADASAWKEYVEAIGRKAPIFTEYDYQNGPILLRLSKRLTPAQAAENEATLNRVR